MGYRTILVCLNEVDRAAVLLQVAADVAQRQEAHLTGLFVIPGMRIYPDNGMVLSPDVLEAHREMFTGGNRTEQVVSHHRIMRSNHDQVGADLSCHAQDGVVDMALANQHLTSGEA